jgi:tubby-related protein 1
MNRLWPKYILSLSEGDKKFLLAAKKKSGNTSNYVIATDSDKMEKSPGCYLGKVRSNFLGTEFIIEDTGANYRKKGGENDLKA